MITGKSWEKILIVTILWSLSLPHRSHVFTQGRAVVLAESGVNRSEASRNMVGYEELRGQAGKLRAGDYAGILNQSGNGKIPDRFRDFELFLTGLAAYEVGEFELGEKTRTRLISEHPESFLGEYLTIDAAYQITKVGRLDEARIIFGNGARNEPFFHREGSRFFYVRGKILLAEGKELKGVESLVACVSRYPGTEPAMFAEKIALSMLVKKGRGKGRKDFGRLALKLGKALSGEGKFQEAEKVLESWRGRAGKRERGTFDLALANALRRMNRYSEAIQILTSRVDGEPRAVTAQKMFFAGIYNWYRGKTDEAEKMLAGVLKEFGRTEAAYKAAYNLGRISEENGRLEDAFTYYRIASKPGGSDADHEAAFRMGLVKFLGGAYDEAERVFSENLDRFPDEEHFFRNLFLKAYTLEKKGETIRAESIFQRILSEKKGGIYYFLSLRKLGKFGGWNAIGNVPFKEITSEVFIERFIQGRKGDTAENSRLERALMFQRLGLYAFSLEELSKANPDGFIPAGDRRTVHPAVSAYLSGNFRRGIELSHMQSSVRGINGIHYLDSPYYLQYPAISLVINGAGRGDLNPFFLHSILRQESLFDYGVVSPAGAIGLGQIMPQTGRWIARQKGIKNFTMELLFDPITNSSFATFYLDHLIRLFGGDIVLATAAYNAGDAAAGRWRKKSGGDSYLYQEVIGYEETRKYVRKVFMNYLYYLNLYGEGWADSATVQ
jgi:soluble lytic murein transglycosylase-like protein/TolA-binding protein